jgi:hypothetical protein
MLENRGLLCTGVAPLEVTAPHSCVKLWSCELWAGTLHYKVFCLVALRSVTLLYLHFCTWTTRKIKDLNLLYVHQNRGRKQDKFWGKPLASFYTGIDWGLAVLKPNMIETVWSITYNARHINCVTNYHIFFYSVADQRFMYYNHGHWLISSGVFASCCACDIVWCGF